LKRINIRYFLFLLFCSIAGLYYFIAAPGQNPTCVYMNFPSSLKDPQELDKSIYAFIDLNKLIQTEQSIPYKRRAYNEHVFVKWDRSQIGDTKEVSSLFVCKQEKGNTAYWQTTTKNVERILMQYYQIGTAELQRGEDYKCDRNCHFFKCKNPCSFTMEMPIDFERLKTLGLIK
jgi:hypothetical protein